MRGRLRGWQVDGLPAGLVLAGVLSVVLAPWLYAAVPGGVPSEASARATRLTMVSLVAGGTFVLAAVAVLAWRGRARASAVFRQGFVLVFVGVAIAALFAHPVHDVRAAADLDARYVEGSGMERLGWGTLESLERQAWRGPGVWGFFYGDRAETPGRVGEPLATVPVGRGDLLAVILHTTGELPDGYVHPLLRADPPLSCEVAHVEDRRAHPKMPGYVVKWDCLATVEGRVTFSAEGRHADEAEYGLSVASYPAAGVLKARVDEALSHLGAGLALGGLALVVLFAGRVPGPDRARAEALAAAALGLACLTWPFAAWVAHRLSGAPRGEDAFVSLLLGTWANFTLLAVVLLVVASARAWGGRDPARARSLACYGAICATVSLLCGGFVVFARDGGSFVGGLTLGLLGFVIAAVAAVQWARGTSGPGAPEPR